MKEAPPTDAKLFADRLGNHFEAAFHASRPPEIAWRALVIARFQTTQTRSRCWPNKIIPEKPAAEAKEAPLQAKGRTERHSEAGNQPSMFEKNLPKRGMKPWFLSKDARMPSARPTICFRGTNPKNRESLLLSLESPITKY
jgi:hypothetical protein